MISDYQMPDMLSEMDRVVLSEDLPEKDLRAGTEGLIVDARKHGRHGYTGPDGYTVEFDRGNEDGVRQYSHLNLSPDQGRPLREDRTTRSGRPVGAGA